MRTTTNEAKLHDALADATQAAAAATAAIVESDREAVRHADSAAQKEAAQAALKEGDTAGRRRALDAARRAARLTAGWSRAADRRLRAALKLEIGAARRALDALDAARPAARRAPNP